MGKKIAKAIGIVLGVIVLCVAALIGYLSITEYKPQATETMEVVGVGTAKLQAGDSLKVLSWNIGYGALGDNADFFMDGGKGVNTADPERVNANLDGILETVKAIEPDLLLLQEVDLDSSRSHHVNEMDRVREALPGYAAAFANNFKVAFLPYPIPPIGKVDSGLVTLSAYGVDSAERIQLPIPFAWPIRMANLKRCLLVERIPLEGSDKELVLVNLHLEAYDDGEGKTAQTRMLKEILESEAQAGNYVIAAGDFNQIFSNADTGAYPAQEGKWQAGEIDASVFASDMQLLMDARTPSCRSLDQPYVGAEKTGFQYYLIDGYILSANVRVDKLETLDRGFVCSDHNPVLAELTLEP